MTLTKLNMGPPRRKLLLYLTVSFMLAYNASAKLSNPYCPKEPYSKVPPRPEMNYSFNTQIVGKWVPSKNIDYIYEYLDKENNKYAFDSFFAGVRYDQIFDFTNNTFIYSINGQHCQFLKNYDSIKNVNEQGLRSLDLLLSPGKNWTYIGPKTIRGVNLQQWSSCNIWGNWTRFKSDYYFTKDGSIPFRLELKGDTQDENKEFNAEFHAIYDYVAFNKKKPPPEVFEIPPGQICTGGPEGLTPPMVTSASFQMEEIDPAGKNVDVKYVDFDKAQKMSKEEDTKTVHIHDYQRGFQFEINKQTKKCTRKPLTRFNGRGQNFNSSGVIHMSTLKHYLYADGKFAKNGVRKARGIPCDVYTKKSQAAEELGVSIIEIYTARPEVSMTNNKGDVIKSYRQPVRIVLKGGINDQKLIVKKQFEIYNFDPEESKYYITYHMDSCFSKEQRVEFKMILGDVVSRSWDKYNKFMKDAAKSISKSLDINLLRVRLYDVRNGLGQTMLYGALFESETYTTMFQTVTNFAAVEPKNRAAYFRYQNKANTPTLCAEYCSNTKTRPFKSSSSCSAFNFDRGSKDCTFFYMWLFDPALHDEKLKGSDHIDFYRMTSSYYKYEPSLRAAWKLLEMKTAQGLINITSNGTVFKAVSVEEHMGYEHYDHARYGQESPFLQFKAMAKTKRMYTKPVEKISNIRSHACAKHCLDTLKYNCEAFKYDTENSECYFYNSILTRESYTYEKNDSNVGTRIRHYTSNFEKNVGRSLLPQDADTVYTDVSDPNLCAGLCMREEDFYCESFDFCDGTCILGRKHIYNTASSSVKEDYSCSHYSRLYLQDYYITKNKKALVSSSVVEIGGIGVKKCASLCSTSQSYDCDVFEFCDIDSLCRLTTKSVKNSDDLVFQESGDCDLYTRQKGRTRVINSFSELTNSGGHSPGAMGGIAIGMIILGIALLLVIALIFFKVRSPSRDSDMSVGFSRERLDND